MNNYTILAINDAPDQLELMAFIMGEAGYRVLTAGSGKKGLKVARQELPDLIISDVNMPEMDGIELCRQIRADNKLCLIPILLVSATCKDTVSILEGFDAGADDYMEVPYEPMHLVAKTAQLIERKRMDTARKQTESTLHFQKTLLEAQCEASIEGILVVTPTGEIISHNRRFVEMWGISNDVLATKSDEKTLESIVEKLVDPQEFSETVSYLYQHPFIKDQAEISLKDGRIFECHTAPVIDADDTHFGRVWFFRDITKRKQTEDAIRFQAHLLDTVEQAVIAVDLDGIITYWNRFAQELYGWTAAEAVGRNIMKLMTPEISQEEAVQNMSQLSASKSWAGEFTMQNKNGTTFPAQVFNSPVNDNKGKLIGIVGISIDITKRKEAETALVDANHRAISEYARLLEKLATLGQKLGSARDLSAVFSAILEFSNASVPCSALFISLYDKEQSTRKGIYMWYNGDKIDISDLESLPVGDGHVGQAIKSGEVTIVNDYPAGKKPTYVYLGFDKDSREPRSAIIAPMKIMGNVIGAIEVQSYEIAAYAQEHATAMQMAANLAANAIENVRLLEQERINAEQLRLSQKLESVGRLAGGIAHDFNNMLTAINGYSDLTLRCLKDGDPLRANIEEIKKAGERSALLTHQLLAFSRKQVLKPKVFDINQVITEVSTMLKRLIGEDIHLITILAPKLGMVEADPGQLTQVIINLAVNARDAMMQGGELIIETNNVYLDEGYAAHHISMRPGSYIQLVVSDSGTGMTGEIQEHIFEPFYTTKEIGKGTGLGLATVYGIVKQSGGYIWAYSEIEQGSAFKIYLPRVDEEVKSPEENIAPEHAPKGTETILLVEDEEIVRNLSRQILETCGYKVIEASDGIEALSICRQPDCKIDLLLTDVVMPKMSGRQLVEHLAAMHSEIKVLYMSGYTDDAIVRQGVIQTGANFIQKPFTFNTLARKIRELLDAKNGLRNS